MPLSGFIDPNSKEAKAKEIKISSTNGNGENVAIVLDNDNSKQDRPITINNIMHYIEN
jgi:hypothetical protein